MKKQTLNNNQSTQFSNKLSDIKCTYINTHLSGNKILDVGAGRCYYSIWLTQQNPELQILALDHLKQENNPRFAYKQVDLEQPLPLLDQEFNTIFAFDIIEHITHETELLHELYRICAPGGILIGSAPHDDDKFLPDYNLTFYHRSDVTHKRYYTRDSLRNALEKSGFIIKNIDFQGAVSPQVIAEFFPKRMQWLIKKTVGLLRRIGIIKTSILASDIFFVAHKPVK